MPTPASSRGLALSGGTLTGPLTIDTSGTVDSLTIDDDESILTSHSEPFDSYIRYHGKAGAGTPYIWLTHADEGLKYAIIDTATGYSTRDKAGGSGMGFTLVNSSNVQRFRASELTGVQFAFGVPPDANIQSGACALWFDPTNGASKLMVKAKSTNGTVVTGSLALA